MLLNLIKYDLKFILKTVFIYGILLIFSAFLHNLTSYDYTPTTFDTSGQVLGGDPDAPVIIQILHTVFYNAVIAMLIALVLNAVIRTWARFKLNMYGDEAYLTHTLPVSRNLLWSSKFLSTIITTMIVITIVALACTILNLTPTGHSLTGVLGVINTDNFTFYPAYIFAVFTQLLFMATCGLTGIVMGYRANNHRGLWSLACGFTFYILGALLLLGFILLWGVLDPNVQLGIFGEVTDPSNFYNVNFATKIIFGVSLVYSATIIITYFLNRKLLQRGINLD